MNKQHILGILDRQKGSYVSGEAIAEALGISRAAVSKAIAGLRQEGYRIESRTNKGYMLDSESDVLLAQSIQKRMSTQRLGHEIRIERIVSSTNLVLKDMAREGVQEGTVLIAEAQSAGRGRMGRSFASPVGDGLYISVMTRPGLPVSQIQYLTMMAVVAVYEAIEALCGIKTDIKWVNDVQYGGRKLCGILTEAEICGENGQVAFVVTGIGINIRGKFTGELEHIATTLEEATGRVVSRGELAAMLLTKLDEHFCRFTATGDPQPFMEIYRKRSCLMHQAVTVTAFDTSYEAIVTELQDDGSLVVELPGGESRTLVSGEVSVRKTRLSSEQLGE